MAILPYNQANSKITPALLQAAGGMTSEHKEFEMRTKYTCEVCGKLFHPLHHYSRFCSRSCYSIHYNNTPAKFWARVDMSGGSDACWPWKGYKDPDGYGQVSWHGKNPRTNRVAWELTYGPIPDGMDVLHVCDNPPCANPGHLFLGTQVDNNNDKDAKGRHGAPRGEQSGRAKLTWQKVREIRRRYALGSTTQRQLAEEYSVSKGCIENVVMGINWRGEP